ncbi:MAG: PA1571 family protein [Pseudomonas sp.]
MSLHTLHTAERRVVPLPPQHPVGGAVIDAQGREIPITEGMIQQACEALEKTRQAKPK